MGKLYPSVAIVYIIGAWQDLSVKKKKPDLILVSY